MIADVTLKQWCDGGEALHLSLLKTGLLCSLHWANRLLQAYARRGGGERAARKLFEEMPRRSSFSWNTLIEAQLRWGRTDLSLDLFRRMPHKNAFSWNLIISGLAKAGDLETARHLFDEMPVRDPVALNCVMHGYLRRDRAREALRLYRETNRETGEDRFVLATALSACAKSRRCRAGAQVHAHILVAGVVFDSALGSSLVDMYSKSGDLSSARAALDAMPEPDEFSFSSLLLGYAEGGQLREAMNILRRWPNPGVVLWNSLLSGSQSPEIFAAMARAGVPPDSSSFTAVLPACGVLTVKQMHGKAIRSGLIAHIAVRTSVLDGYAKGGCFEEALEIFAEAPSRDPVIGNAMIAAFSDAGMTLQARQLFDEMPEKTLISWNSIVVAYSKNGYCEEALEFFSEMRRHGVVVDRVSLAAAISACCGGAHLRAGEQVFALAVAVGFRSDGVVTTSLIDLYCKCGFPGDGRVLFEEMDSPDLAAWNAMLAGYAANGLGGEALGLFEGMREGEVRPNEVTFLALLSGCCHCGLVSQGQRLLAAMERDFGVSPGVEHYACAVDLLVRAGRMEEALSFLDAAPVDDDAVALTSLLRGCVAQGRFPAAGRVAERLISIDERRAGSYVQLSAVAAGRGMWDLSLKLRGLLKQRGIVKNPGVSWTDG